VPYPGVHSPGPDFRRRPVPCCAWPRALSSQLCGDAQDRTILESSDLPPQTTRGRTPAAQGRYTPEDVLAPPTTSRYPTRAPNRPVHGDLKIDRHTPDHSALVACELAHPPADVAGRRACHHGRRRESPRDDRFGGVAVVVAGWPQAEVAGARIARIALPRASIGLRGRLASDRDASPSSSLLHTRGGRVAHGRLGHRRTRSRRVAELDVPRETVAAAPHRGRSPAARSTRGATDTRTSSHRSPQTCSRRAAGHHGAIPAPYASAGLHPHRLPAKPISRCYAPAAGARQPAARVRHGARRGRHPDGASPLETEGVPPLPLLRPARLLSLTPSRQHQGPDQGVFACSGSTVFHVEHPRIGSTITPRGAASYLIQAASCLTASCVAPTDHTTHGRTSAARPRRRQPPRRPRRRLTSSPDGAS
jgi:hypothetical protein